MLSIVALAAGFVVPSMTVPRAAACASSALCMSAAPAVADTVKADADAVFSVIDVDGDGTITLTELTTHLTSSGYKSEAVAKIFEACSWPVRTRRWCHL